MYNVNATCTHIKFPLHLHPFLLLTLSPSSFPSLSPVSILPFILLNLSPHHSPLHPLSFFTFSPSVVSSVHTGIQFYNSSLPKIPTACITVEDAEMLDRYRLSI